MKYIIVALLAALGYGGAVAADIEPIRQISEEQLPGVVRAIDSATNGVTSAVNGNGSLAPDAETSQVDTLGFKQISTRGKCFFGSSFTEHITIIDGSIPKGSIKIIGIPTIEAREKLNTSFPDSDWTCAISEAELEPYVSPTGYLPTLITGRHKGQVGLDEAFFGDFLVVEIQRVPHSKTYSIRVDGWGDDFVGAWKTTDELLPTIPEAIKTEMPETRVKPLDMSDDQAVAEAFNASPVTLLYDTDIAIAHMNRAIEFDNTKPFAYYNRGEVYITHGDFNRALDDFNRAVELAGGDTGNGVYNPLSVCPLRQRTSIF